MRVVLDGVDFGPFDVPVPLSSQTPGLQFGIYRSYGTGASGERAVVIDDVLVETE